MSERLIVLIPPRRRAIAGIPGKPLQVRGGWPMQDGKIGVWLGEPGQSTGQRWPLTNVLPAELKKWEVRSQESERDK